MSKDLNGSSRDSDGKKTTPRRARIRPTPNLNAAAKQRVKHRATSKEKSVS